MIICRKAYWIVGLRRGESPNKLLFCTANMNVYITKCRLQALPRIKHWR